MPPIRCSSRCPTTRLGRRSWRRSSMVGTGSTSACRRDPRMEPRLSSSPSERRGLFDGVLARGGVREATGDRAWLQAMLDAEAALAAALVDVGFVSPSDAAAIRGACRAERYDVDEL